MTFNCSHAGAMIASLRTIRPFLQDVGITQRCLNCPCQTWAMKTCNCTWEGHFFVSAGLLVMNCLSSRSRFGGKFETILSFKYLRDVLPLQDHE